MDLLKISDLLKPNLNVKGELHLDHKQTAVLFELIEIQEREIEQARRTIADIQYELRHAGLIPAS